MAFSVLLGVYSLCIVVSSLIGGWAATRIRFTHLGMQGLLSFVGGFMLGIGILHMLPHSFAACQSIDLVAVATLVGLLFTFLMIRLLHFHEHGPIASPVHDKDAGVAAEHHHHHHHHDAHDHEHHHHDHEHAHTHPVNTLSWSSVAIGLSIHTLMDGIALGSALIASEKHGHAQPWGLAVFLAILFHKPLDALSVTGLMAASGWSTRSQHMINAGFSAMCPVGAAMVALGAHQLAAPDRFLGFTQAFAAGAFLCISLSDLLPEVQFHSHDRFRLSLILLLGVAAAIGTRWMELY
jgi:zinc and cadmium transporter